VLKIAEFQFAAAKGLLNQTPEMDPKASCDLHIVESPVVVMGGVALKINITFQSGQLMVRGIRN
jgi:hypothetical protein